MPDPLHHLNHKSADNAAFVSTAIDELVSAQRAEVQECMVYQIDNVSSPLSVVFNAEGKPQLVLGLTTSCQITNLSTRVQVLYHLLSSVMIPLI